jgi:hypothetical protein
MFEAFLRQVVDAPVSAPSPAVPPMAAPAIV